MKINNVNITTWNARQSTVRFGQAAYANAAYWKSGAAVPTLFQGIVGFKGLTVTLIVKGANRNAILKNVSDIVAACRDKTTLIFDDLDHRFTGYLTSASNEEMAKRQFHRLTLQFNGYEHTAQIESSGTSSVTVSNPGNLPSPARVALTPTANLQSITLTGICRDPYTGDDQPVVVNNLTNGKLVVLNGINGGITEAPGNPKDVDIWHLPIMKPGTNTITCDNAHVSIVVQTVPIYA